MTPLLRLVLLAHAALVLMAFWVGGGGVGWLVAAGGAVSGLVFLVLRSSPPMAVARGVALLPMAVVSGVLAEAQLTRISSGWEARALQREAQVRERLSTRLDELLLAGEEAAARLVSLQDPEAGRPRGPIPLDLVGPGVDAVALFGPGGELLAWEGGHQGPIPREARLGLSPYIYQESALFGYLYVSRPLPEGTGTAVAASLLRSDLPATLEEEAADFVSRFHRETGARIQVGREERVEGEAAWGLTWEREVLFSVGVVPESEAEARARVGGRWRAAITLLLLLAWGVLARALRNERHGRIAAGGALLLLALILPVGDFLGGGRVFSPADLLLPGPVPLNLGDLLLLGGVGVLLLGFLGPSHAPRFRLPAPFLLPLVGGVGGWGLLALLRAGASRDLLLGPEPLWVLFQLSAFLLLSLFLALLLRRRAEARPSVREGVSAGDARYGGGHGEEAGWALAVGVAILLGAGGTLAASQWGAFPSWLALLWFLPLAPLAWRPPRGGGWRREGLTWVVAGVLASSLVLPWAWGSRIEARMADAADRIERLGTRADPFLEFLLLRTGEEARELSLLGRNPVEVLYGAWSGSGLAREGVPVWLTWWSPDGFAQEELRIGVSSPRPAFPPDLRMAALIEGEPRLVRAELADAHYVVAAPLARGAVLTAVIPPRRGFSGDSPLGPLFSPARADVDPVTLIPLLPGDPAPLSDLLRWERTEEGWVGETALELPEATHLVRYSVTLPRPSLLVARGTLLLLGSLLLLLLLWAGGRRLAGPSPLPLARVVAGLGSFRVRVTFALFAFFLGPTILFGMLSYRTLSGASVRTAEALAARAAEDAAAGFADTGGALDLLASRVGSDLLLYEGGRLVGGSQRELVELGLYQGWLPPAVHRTLSSASAGLLTTPASLGGWDYVVAYRRLPGGLVLASPAPLQAGATAVRQREVADLLAFTLVLGAGLSILLSLLVGRALARPIQTLQVASERVGAGNMEVHLPADRADEFGAVFGAFNRMVDRLARTRRALVRSSRRTRAIVEEVATGVIAVDAQGRVTLANPRAEALLGTPLVRNQPLLLPGGARRDDEGSPMDAGGREVGRWVAEFFRDGLTEAGTEVTVAGRRIRLRARRISGGSAPAGAVLALEDVTDELRTERILAWGEMAQQVAHEVKNPLTPIKLGVQHIRRAWLDGRPDYDRILERNVEAILTEIDRLASIASSFSRYAAPAPGRDEVRGPVELPRVVEEVMILYGAGEGPVRFAAQLEPGLPPVLGGSDELKEVLVNLLENARAALPAGGEVRVEARAEPGGVQLSVVDNGTGIPADLLPHVFEPHFSTRATGSGLGLAIVRRLVEAWGGWVEARSAEGEGTTVTAHLKAWSEEPPALSGGGASIDESG